MSDKKMIWVFEHEQGLQRRVVHHASQDSALYAAVDFLIRSWVSVEHQHRAPVKALLIAGNLSEAVTYCEKERVFGHSEVIRVRSMGLVEHVERAFVHGAVARLPVPQQTYDVTVRRTLTSYASVTVSASSEAEARQAARKVAALSAEWGEEDPELDASDTRCVLMKEET